MKVPNLPPALRRWPLPLLLVSLALTAVAAVDAHRAVVSQRETATRALREFASFAGWSYTQHLEDRLSVMLRETLGAVNHGERLHESPNIPRAGELAHYIPFDTRCNCHRARFGPNPSSLFAFRLGEDSLDVAVNSHPYPTEGWEVDRPVSRTIATDAQGTYSAEDRRWIVDTLTRLVHSVVRPDRGFTLVVGRGTPNVPERVLAYTLMPTTWGDTMLYGAEYTRAGLVDVLAGVLDSRSLLPATFTAKQRNRDVVVVRVNAGGATPIFDSAPGDSSPYGTRVQMDPRFGALALDVLVRPQQANMLVIGGLPQSHLPFLMAVLALAAALSVVAVTQLRRETELARMRSDFVSNVSHELRTPLAQIRLFTETLRLGRAPTNEQRDWSLAHIERETTRLGHLVENVLRFSRTGRDDASVAVPVDVTAEARRIVEEFRPLAASKHAQVEAHLEATPRVPLRPDALRRMLLNLLDNAVKYGPTGQTVQVSVNALEGEVRVSVMDEGPGVAAAERESVWRPFQRGSAAAIAAGSGIGLTIVRDVAAQHGGRAWVEAAAGGGARFIIALPVTPVSDAAPNGNGRPATLGEARRT